MESNRICELSRGTHAGTLFIIDFYSISCYISQVQSTGLSIYCIVSHNYDLRAIREEHVGLMP